MEEVTALLGVAIEVCKGVRLVDHYMIEQRFRATSGEPFTWTRIPVPRWTLLDYAVLHQDCCISERACYMDLHAFSLSARISCIETELLVFESWH
jgi:hypothetical protein